MNLNRRALARLLSVGGLLAGSSTWAQAPASGPSRLLVGFVPGGTVDLVARALAEDLRKAGIPILIENRPGAAGRLAMDALMAASADGATFLLTPSTGITLLPHAYPNLRPAVAELAYAGVAGDVQFGLVVHPDTGARTLAEFLERARKDPKQGFFGTPGAGSVMQLLGDLLARRAKAPLQGVPYKGGAAAINDVVGGVLPAAITAVPNLMAMHKAKRLRMLAVTAEQPLPGLADVPTFESAGFPDLTASEYMCVVARKGLPPALFERWNAALAAAAGSASMAAVMDRLGFQPSPPLSPEAMARKIAADSARWQVAVHETGFKPAE